MDRRRTQPGSRMGRRDAVSDAARSVQEHAAPLEEFLRNAIESRPYTSVAVALSLGWFIGRMGVRSDY